MCRKGNAPRWRTRSDARRVPPRRPPMAIITLCLTLLPTVPQPPSLHQVTETEPSTKGLLQDTVDALGLPSPEYRERLKRDATEVLRPFENDEEELRFRMDRIRYWMSGTVGRLTKFDRYRADTGNTPGAQDLALPDEYYERSYVLALSLVRAEFVHIDSTPVPSAQDRRRILDQIEGLLAHAGGALLDRASGTYAEMAVERALAEKRSYFNQVVGRRGVGIHRVISDTEMSSARSTIDEAAAALGQLELSEELFALDERDPAFHALIENLDSVRLEEYQNKINSIVRVLDPLKWIWRSQNEEVSKLLVEHRSLETEALEHIRHSLSESLQAYAASRVLSIQREDEVEPGHKMPAQDVDEDSNGQGSPPETALAIRGSKDDRGPTSPSDDPTGKTRLWRGGIAIIVCTGLVAIVIQVIRRRGAESLQQRIQKR